MVKTKENPPEMTSNKHMEGRIKTEISSNMSSHGNMGDLSLYPARVYLQKDSGVPSQQTRILGSSQSSGPIFY